LPTAILIDGGFFVKRFRRIEPHNEYNAERAADSAFRWALSHLKQGTEKRNLYRIFFYDCPPIEKKMHNPISGKCIDFGKTDEAVFRKSLHELLRHKRKVALRLGHLSEMATWTASPECIEDLLKGKKTRADLTAEDLFPNVRQKGVDMRIGIDISSLALKHQVDQIVLIAGDADFVPAAKLARREGIDFVLDPMWSGVPSNLNEHVDGIRSVCPKPKKPTAGSALPPPPAAPALPNPP
jgi:uncharacterized LabA/DUF88 family protein